MTRNILLLCALPWPFPLPLSCSMGLSIRSVIKIRVRRDLKDRLSRTVSTLSLCMSPQNGCLTVLVTSVTESTPSLGTVIPSLGSCNHWKVLPYIELKPASCNFCLSAPVPSLAPERATPSYTYQSFKYFKTSCSPSQGHYFHSNPHRITVILLILQPVPFPGGPLASGPGATSAGF